MSPEDVETIRVRVDGVEVDVPAGATVLEAAKQADRWVPTLCYDERQDPFGACRVCLVGSSQASTGDDGARAVIPACTTPCTEDLAIHTEDPRARRVATAVVELVLSELPMPPPGESELAEIAERLEVGELRWPGEVHPARPADDRHPYLTFRHDLCISCGRCVRACDEVQGTFALTATGRGFGANIAAGLDQGFRDSACVSCGACADTCPTEAISEPLVIALTDDAERSEASCAAVEAPDTTRSEAKRVAPPLRRLTGG